MQNIKLIIANPFQLTPMDDPIVIARIMICIIILLAIIIRKWKVLILLFAVPIVIKYILVDSASSASFAGSAGLIEKFDTSPPIDNTNFKTPTQSNPFMNYQLGDITNNPTANKPDGFAQNNAFVRQEMEANFNSRHVDNEGDIWGRKFSSLAFYTIPGNSPVTDADGTFQNWLYGRSYPTCREDVRFCAVKPPRTETPNENGVMDRTVNFGIGLDMNTDRRVAMGAERGLASLTEFN